MGRLHDLFTNMIAAATLNILQPAAMIDLKKNCQWQFIEMIGFFLNRANQTYFRKLKHLCICLVKNMCSRLMINSKQDN